MRYVSCRDEDGSVADERACITLPRPVAEKECFVTPCGQWKALDWSTVSKFSGIGRGLGHSKGGDYNTSQMLMGNI